MHPLEKMEIKQVPFLTFKDYGEAELCRLSELLKSNPFPTVVTLDDVVYLDMETPFSVEIEVLSDEYQSAKQTVELKAGQLAVWFAGDVWIFNMNNDQRVMTRYAAMIADVNSGELL